ncbi:MAG: prolyl oligopeptidase family serine peptidase, partial [Alloprevotella sp.]
MRRTVMFIAWSLWCTAAMGSGIKVDSFRHVGPLAVCPPVMIDNTDLKGTAYSPATLLETPVDLNATETAPVWTDSIIVAPGHGQALHLLRFDLTSRGYSRATICVKGLKASRLFVDGKGATAGTEMAFEPGHHAVVIKLLSTAGTNDTLDVSIQSDFEDLLAAGASLRKPFTFTDAISGKRIHSTSLSPSGRYLLTRHYETFHDGRTAWRYTVTERKTGKVLTETNENIAWMPRTDAYWLTRNGGKGYELVCIDPETKQQKTLATGLPQDGMVIAPTEDFLILTHVEKGPQEDRQLYEIVDPDDRQPGWRDRNTLLRYDLGTGLTQQLTFGYAGAQLQDISPCGRYLLYSVGRRRLTARPTTLYSLFRLDMQTMKTDTLVSNDGFFKDAAFTSDADHLYMTGSPEFLDGLGKNVPEGRIPSMYDYQLYALTVGESPKPLTKDFNPSVKNCAWSNADKRIYFTAEDRDCVHAFRVDPASGKTERLDIPEDMVSSVSLAHDIPLMACCGESANNAQRAYTMDLRKGKATVVEDLDAALKDGMEMGRCEPWDFVNSRGDTICGRFYLPPNFTSNRRYPLLVYYYGGCSPTSRSFATIYPFHAYAALDYVVYVIQPSGATGFGQEFSSRHVNTAGEGVAQDIIEGVKQFVAEHKFVNDGKIGCLGASYGGFMTQYLQTKTDLFAAAVSHAGIS